jgi:hypothetical protein
MVRVSTPSLAILNPQAWRSMWAWTWKPSLALALSRSTIFWKPSTEIGALRSDINRCVALPTLTLQPAQGSQLTPGQRMRCWCARLGPADVQDA